MRGSSSATPAGVPAACRQHREFSASQPRPSHPNPLPQGEGSAQHLFLNNATMNISAPFIHRPIATLLLALGLLHHRRRRSPLPPRGTAAQRRHPHHRRHRRPTGGRPGDHGRQHCRTRSSVASAKSPALPRSPAPAALGSQPRIVIQFDIDRPIEGAANDVQAAINAAYSDLPSAICRPGPTTASSIPADAPILTLSMTSGHPQHAPRLYRRRRHYPRSAAEPDRRRRPGHHQRCRQARCPRPPQPRRACAPPGLEQPGRLHRHPQQPTSTAPIGDFSRGRLRSEGHPVLDGQISQADRLCRPGV